jgi:serine/threonine protein kinase/Leucine-rich repeat (LRR) protein
MAAERAENKESDDRLYAVLLDYLESTERGHEPDKATLLANHPELAPELQAFLDTWLRVEGMTEPIRSASRALQAAVGSAQPPPLSGSQAGEFAGPTGIESQELGYPQRRADEPLRAMGQDPAGWLRLWLNKHPPISAEQYPFLNTSQSRGAIGRLGPYRLLEVVGSGGMGVVFRGEDDALRRTVAVKVLRAGLAADPVARERFLREARAIAALDHENVVAVHHVGEECGVPFMGMQWLTGISLEDHLRQAAPLDVPTVVRLGRQIALGLAAAHGRGLLHRDIKPANLWLESLTTTHSRGERPNAARSWRIKILDFGLVRTEADDANLTRSGVAVGTPAYMAPEQAQGGVVDARSDLFSLGVALYRMCTGRLPFAPLVGANQSVAAPTRVGELNRAVPDALAALVMQLIDRDPVIRPATAAEVAERLQALQGLAGAPSVPEMRAVSNQAMPAGLHSSGMRRWLWWSAASFFGLAVVIVLAYLSAGLRDRLAANRGETSGEMASVSGTKPADAGEPKDKSAIGAIQRGAAAWALSMGGKVTVLSPEREQVLQVSNELPTGDFQVVGLNLGGTAADDSGLAHIQALSGLRELDLSGTRVDDAGLACVATLQKLQYLNLVNTKVTDAGLIHLVALTDLQRLILPGTKVTDAGMKQLAKINSLQSIDLSQTQVGDAGIATLVAMNHLESLYLAQTRVTDAGLLHLAPLKDFHGLNVADTKVSDAGLVHLAGLTNLYYLHLGRTPVTDAGLVHLAGLTNLQYLHLSGTQVTDDGLTHLAAMKKLRMLFLNDTRVTDAGLAHVLSLPLPPLTAMELIRSRISAAGARAVKSILPGIKLEWSEPNRSAAEAILAAGGSVQVRTAGQKEPVSVKAATDLPADYFRLISARLTGARQPSRDALGSLRKLSDSEFDDFQVLDLSDSSWTDADLELLAGLQCRRLELDRAPIYGPGLVHLNLPRLTELRLGCPTLSFLGMSYVGELKRLERLSLANSGATDASLKYMHDLVNLRELDLTGTRVTSEGIAALRKVLPRCDIRAGTAGGQRTPGE